MSKITRFFRFLISYFKRNKVLGIDITSDCNLNCSHCYWFKTKNPQKELTDEEWRETFLKFREKGVKSAFLTGGEPTLRQNIIKIAYNIFPVITVSSNGLNKIPEDIQCRIFVSVDGPKKVHNKIRRAKVFDKILENIKDDKRVIITPTLTTKNYQYIKDLVEIAKKSNVEGITFNLYTSHQGLDDPLLLKDTQLDQALAKLREVWEKNKKIVFLTPKMLKLFKTKEHYPDCFFRGKNVLVFDSNMGGKLCTLGNGVKCETCGCIIPIMGKALKKGDLRAWFLFDKFYPEKYYNY